jgi:2-(1,2-epoxy-1,2-dihydrophenyl)acetyl-CoA isomerase
MSDRAVVVDITAGIAAIQLARPERANALDAASFRELAAALDRCTADPDVRAITLSGQGSHFSAGGDLDHPVFSAPDAEARREHLRPAYEVTARILDAPVPVVTAIHGRCAGAALAIVLASDLRVGAPSSTFSLDFVRLGIMPDMGVSWLLGRSVGTGRALELALTAEVLDAPTALEWGLLSRVVDDGTVLDAATQIARSFAEFPPAGLRAARWLVREAPFMNRDQAFATEIDAVVELLASPEAQSRLDAFRRRKR